MAVSNTHIKYVQIGDNQFPINASQIDGHTWSDITNLVEAGFSVFVSWSAGDYVKTTQTQAYVEEKAANVPYGVQLFWNNGDSPSGPPYPAYSQGTLTATNADKNKIYMVAVGGGARTRYDEYVAAQQSSGGITEWVWERLGSTDVDLSNYPTRSEAGKAGTYPTSTPSTNVTGSGGEQTAQGTASVTVPAQSMTSSSAGGFTIQGSNFGFSGSAQTITINNDSNDNVWVAKHTYQPAGSIGGSQSVGAHSHTVTLSTATVVKTVTSGTTTVATGEFTGTPSTDTFVKEITTTGTSVLTGVKASSTTTAVTGISTSGSTFVTGYAGGTPGNANVITGVSSTTNTAVQAVSSGTTSVFNSATVDASGILSFGTTAAVNSVSSTTFTAIKSVSAAGTVNCLTEAPALATATALTGVTKDTATVVTGVGANGTTTALTSASVKTTASALTGFTLETTAVVNSVSASTLAAMTNVTINNGGGHTINGSNFTFTGTTATLTHSVSGTPTTATADKLWVELATRTYTITPSGSITGSQAVSGHTHSVTFASTTATGTASVAVSAHTHSLSNHTHNVVIDNCETND